MDEELSQQPFAWSDRVLRDEVVGALRHILDPDLHKDIVSCGFVKALKVSPSGKVTFCLELTTPACPEKGYFLEECHRRLKALDWVVDVDITIGAQSQFENRDSVSTALKDIKEIILVTSCKGGVGKSTISTNMAFILAQAGARVGLLDLDVSGASFPTLLPQIGGGVLAEDAMLTPLKSRGSLTPKRLNSKTYESGTPIQDLIDVPDVLVMSPGWLRKDYLAMRGPLASELVYQLLLQTDWGMLDYLIVDMPPGTSDIHLSVAELCPNAKFVVVTTPHDLSIVDSTKGYQMYAQAGLGFCGLVLNEIFPKSSAPGQWNGQWTATSQELDTDSVSFISELKSIAPYCELPRSSDLSFSSFIVNNQVLGPLALAGSAYPDGAQALDRLKDFTSDMIRALSRRNNNLTTIPHVKIDASGGLEVVTGLSIAGEDIYIVRADKARSSCRCALCAARKIPISPELSVTAVRSVNLTSVRVVFSDGHESTLLFREILSTEPSTRSCELLLDAQW